MKKIFILFFSLIFVLCSCSKKQAKYLSTPTPELLIKPQRKATPTFEPARYQMTMTAAVNMPRTPVPKATPTFSAPIYSADNMLLGYSADLPKTQAASDKKSSCSIKGNYKSMIYHCLNSPSYDRTTDNITYFCTPEEAERAGFRAPKNVSWCQY